MCLRRDTARNRDDKIDEEHLGRREVPSKAADGIEEGGQHRGAHSAQMQGGWNVGHKGPNPKRQVWEGVEGRGENGSGRTSGRGPRADPLGANRAAHRGCKRARVRYGATLRCFCSAGTRKQSQGEAGCRGWGQVRKIIDCERTKRNLREGQAEGSVYVPKRAMLEVQATSPIQSAFQVPEAARAQSPARRNRAIPGDWTNYGNYGITAADCGSAVPLLQSTVQPRIDRAASLRPRGRCTIRDSVPRADANPYSLSPVK
ncbi:hypothetical protein B0H17DRAFT_1183265 [Mycena rosella]|uniref:Uncharacterized protein n=1 Tax=Mycena rosella TaxID=1033263 RepID=A0AAD7D0Q9_MYCRO|nr:hypothetical protein B0H17DRAFT_1183265 [Mycena rosella]